MRIVAAAAIGQLEQASEEVLDALLGLTQDGALDASVRRAAAAALGQLGRADDPIVAGLLGLLSLEVIPASTYYVGEDIDWTDKLKNAAYDSLKLLFNSDGREDE